MTNTFQFGSKSYVITAAKWNSKRQLGEITFEDDDGAIFQAEAWGMLPQEQRQACLDKIRDMWIERQAADIGNTAAKLDSELVRLAKACGNHPYEDG